MTIPSGCLNFVVVSVRLEQDVTLRTLRIRLLSLITPHWPRYVNAIGMIMGDFNIWEAEEGKVNVWNLTFTDGDM